MSLSLGQRLGRYEIITMIGAGGMGQVYRARDPRLDRAVAIKILPPQFAETPEFLARFEREARALSQLSHPNVCTLFDVGVDADQHFLVMELLDGETLAARLKKGPLPLVEALRCGVGLARGLEGAHRGGVIHRDLKPGNVMLTSSGVKLLDFGLARDVPAGSTVDQAVLTVSVQDVLTRDGAVLGTLPYMAPEQLQGLPADTRTDILGLGAVLYEMISGRRPFVGATQAALASAILTSEPLSLRTLHPGTPPSVDRLVRTCLAKDPDGRWRTAHDIALQLDAALDELKSPAIDTVVPQVRTNHWLWTAAAGALGVAATLAGMWALGRVAPASPLSTPVPVAFVVPPSSGGTFITTVEAVPMAVAPDGSTIAVVAVGAEGRRIYLRRLDDATLVPLEGTDDASSVFWSPDGRSLAFVAAGKIKRVTPGGGSPVPLFDVPETIGMTGSWGADGRIVFSTVEGHAIWSGSTSGGERTMLLEPDGSKGETRVFWPRFLPDGRRFLYMVGRGDQTSSLMLFEPGRAPVVIIPEIFSFAEYVDPGFLVYGLDGALVARPFDAATGRVEGEPVPVADRVVSHRTTLMTAFSSARSGLVVYQSARDVSRVAWIDRQGRQTPALPTGEYQTVRFSPDRRRVLFDRLDPRLGTWDLWELDVERGTEDRLTPSAGTDTAAVYTPDGRHLLYAHSTGAPPRLTQLHLHTRVVTQMLPQDRYHRPLDVHPSGSPLLFTWRSVRGPFHLHTLALGGTTAVPEPLWHADLEGRDARFSPDGTMVAFVSAETGRDEVYLATFPAGRRVTVSNGGGRVPRWHSTGRDLYYVTARDLVAVPVTGGAVPSLGEPRAILPIDAGKPWVSYDVAPDGDRFIVVVPEIVAQQEPLSVKMNWRK